MSEPAPDTDQQTDADENRVPGKKPLGNVNGQALQEQYNADENNDQRPKKAFKSTRMMMMVWIHVVEFNNFFLDNATYWRDWFSEGYTVCTQPNFTSKDVVNNVYAQNINGAIPCSSPLGTGFTFNGTDSIQFNENLTALLAANVPRTISLWFNLKDNITSQSLVSFNFNSAADYTGMDVWLTNGSLALHLINSWPTNAIKVSTTNKFTPDVWNNLIITYDGSKSASGVKIYINNKH